MSGIFTRLRDRLTHNNNNNSNRPPNNQRLSITRHTGAVPGLIL